MAKAMSMKTLNENFRRTLEKLYEGLQHYKANGEEEMAWLTAWQIGGAVQLAEEMGLIDFWQRRDIFEKACRAAQAKEEDFDDEVC